MKTKQKQLLLAICIGAIALLGNHFYLQGRIDELTPKQKHAILTTKGQVRAGQPLTKSMVKVKKIPKAFVPKAAVKASELSLYLGQEVNVDVQSGDYLLEGYFSTRGTIGRTLSAQIDSDNFRAISLPVNETNSLARSIVAGDHVDIMLSFNIPAVKHMMSVVLMQNVPVIATGSYSVSEQELGGRTGSRRYNTLTLKTTVEDAVRLTYARQAGKINLLLRNSQDANILDVSPITSVMEILSATDQEKVQRILNSKKKELGVDTDKLRSELQRMVEAQSQINKSRRRK